MPIKLIPPRRGKSPNWTVRGTYFGVRVDQTTGTSERKLAAQILRRVQDNIERGTFARGGDSTFASAALSYINGGGEGRFILRIAEFFGDRPLVSIDQAAVDEAAIALYPNASSATRNRQVYTPISAVFKSVGRAEAIRRPKGAQGKPRLFFLTPEQAGLLLNAARGIDAEFELFMTFLLYTGCRLSEALNLEVSNVNLGEGWAYVRKTKNGSPRLVHLPSVVVTSLSGHPRGLSRRGRVFRFTKCGRLYDMFNRAAHEAKVAIPERVAFHVLRHTWGAWMRRYGGLDTTGLVQTGAWRSRNAAAVYEHAVQSEEARRADLLPNIRRDK
jgi:integrase